MPEPKFIPLNPCLPCIGFNSVDGSSNSPTARLLPVGKVIWTYSGTSALGLCANILRNAGVSYLIAPSFNCGHEIEPFKRCGFDFEFYKIDRSGQFDFGELAALLRGKHQVLLVTHFFGFPQNIESIQSLCHEHGVWLLEDCAHAFLSRTNSRLLGGYGDIAIYSLRKTLPLPDGGAVVILHPDLKRIFAKKKPKTFSVGNKVVKLTLDRLFLIAEQKNAFLFEILRKLKGSLLLGNSVLKSILTSKNLHFYSPDNESYAFDDRILEWKMSRASQILLRHINFKDLISKRRANYKYVLIALKELKNVRPLFTDLPDGVCPLEFPIVPPFHARLPHTVLDDYPFLYKWWPYFHQSVPWDHFPESRWLKENCRIVAIHQDMEHRHLDYLIDCVIAADKRF